MVTFDYPGDEQWLWHRQPPSPSRPSCLMRDGRRSNGCGPAAGNGQYGLYGLDGASVRVTLPRR